MSIKLIFTFLALLSIAIIVGFIISNDSELFTVAPVDNPSTTFPENGYQQEENINRAPGTIATFDNSAPSDTAIVKNDGVVEVSTDFFQLSNNTDLYDLYYDGQSGVISITLYGADTKKSRDSAEDYILDELPYTKDQWCSFVVRVFTNEYENPLLAGQELGLSFCPNSVKL
ncbi:MAG: hypothetical protein V4668_04050 [Patescibacteria group bacterium]